MLAKDKRETGSKSCEESSERESEVVVMAAEVAAMGQTDEHSRAIVMRSLRRLRKIREAVQDRKQQLEDEIWKEVDDYIFSWEPEKTRGDPERKDLARGAEEQR